MRCWLTIHSDDGEDEDEETKAEGLGGDAAAAEDDGDLSEAELERRRRLEYEEEDAPPIEEKVQYAEVRLPKIPMASQTQKVGLARVCSNVASQLIHVPHSAASCQGWTDTLHIHKRTPYRNTDAYRAIHISYRISCILNQQPLIRQFTTAKKNPRICRLRILFVGDGGLKLLQSHQLMQRNKQMLVLFVGMTDQCRFS